MGGMLAPCLLMLALDHAQTLDIKHHRGMHEENRIMGRHPGAGTVHAYFAALAGFYTLTDQLAPPGIAHASQVFCVSAHAAGVESNVTLGLRLRWW